MLLLVLNAGSSSVKFTLYEADGWQVVADGMAERLGSDAAQLDWALPEAPPEAWPGLDQQGAIHRIIDRLAELTDLASLGAVGHRVVHGGERFQGPTLVTPEVLAALQQLVPLAPLHNPANLAGIEAASERLPHVPQVACFDTAFFAALPPQSYRYAVPERWYRDYGIRRYGFHGHSHRYVALRTAEAMGQPLETLRLITLHLGSGASAAAIRDGQPMMTSMGFTTLPGLVMGTRPGDLDAGIVFHLVRQGEALDRLEQESYGASGLKGLCGDNDHRDLHARAAQGDGAARLALAVELERLVLTVGGYWALLGGADALVFTAGVGEHDALTRARLIEALGGLGLRLESAANRQCSGQGAIHAAGSSAAIWVMPTDEALMIAEETLEMVSGSSS